MSLGIKLEPIENQKFTHDLKRFSGEPREVEKTQMRTVSSRTDPIKDQEK